MSEAIRFDLPIWSATVLHNTPNTDGIWLRAFNAESEEDALNKVRELFKADGLNEIRIYRIELAELVSSEGGEEDA